jgi:hypothetical protein
MDMRVPRAKAAASEAGLRALKATDPVEIFQMFTNSQPSELAKVVGMGCGVDHARSQSESLCVDSITGNNALICIAKVAGLLHK